MQLHMCKFYWLFDWEEIIYDHSWHRFTNNGQLWKLFSYITIRILKISFRNCVSSLLSTHFSVKGFSFYVL